MITAQNIITLINSFDSTYMMSDSSQVYSDGQTQEREIIALLESASNDTLIEVRNSINLSSRFLEIPFGKYFEGLTEATAKPQSKLSKIMSTAWEMFRAELFPSFSQALKAAWAKYRLVTDLKNGIARFSFIKADGSTRNAIGTLRNGNFKYNSKGSTKKLQSHVVRYFDIVADGFRSVRIDRLIAA